jgi:predicted nucleic acid-binding protein
MKWLFDTNVVSEATQMRPNPGVVAALSKFPAEQTAISVVTLAELRDGAFLARGQEKRARLLQWIENAVEASFQERTLNLTVDILIDWIALSRRLSAAGRPRAAADLLLAATARVHGLVMVTRNWRHFADTGLAVFDPWSGRTHQMGEA